MGDSLLDVLGSRVLIVRGIIGHMFRIGSGERKDCGVLTRNTCEASVSIKSWKRIEGSNRFVPLFRAMVWHMQHFLTCSIAVDNATEVSVEESRR